MTLKKPIAACLVAFLAPLSLAACNDFAFHVATYPTVALTAPQGPTPIWDYENKVNPVTNISTSGPYDIEDLYRDKDGFALPGASQIR